MRSTRDRNCPTGFALLPECAGNTRSHVLEQETVLDRVRGETRDRTCQNTNIVLLRVREETRDRTCQNTNIVLLPEYADNTTARVKDQRCETARLCRQHDR